MATVTSEDISAPGAFGGPSPTPAGPEAAGAVDLPLSAALALAAGRAADDLGPWLASLAGQDRATAKIDVDGLGPVEVPTAALRLLLDALEDLAEGRVVTVAPYDLPVGTEAAADVLGVSRTWVVKLLDGGRLRSDRNGSKRRVRLGDLLRFRREDDRRRRGDWGFLDDVDDED